MNLLKGGLPAKKMVAISVLWAIGLWFCLGNVHIHWHLHSLAYSTSLAGLTRAVALTLAASLLIRKPKTTADMFVLMLGFFAVMPIFVIFNSMDTTGYFDIATLSSFYIFSFVSRWNLFIRVRYPAWIKMTAHVILVSTVLAVFAALIYYIPIPNLFHGIFDVYELRAENTVAVPGVIFLLSRSLGYVIIPFYIIFAVRNKNLVLATTAISTTILLFLFTGFKSFLLAACLPPIIYFIYYHNYWRYKLILAIVATIVASGIITNHGYWYAMAIRRPILTPQTIQVESYKLYSTIDATGIHWPYPGATTPSVPPPGKVLSQYILGHERSNMVSGLFGAGYAAHHYWGMHLYAILSGLLVKLFCLLALNARKEQALLAGIASPMLIPILGTSPMLVFFSYGGLLLVSLMPIIAEPLDERPVKAQ